MDEINTLIFRTDRLGDFIISCPFIISYKKKNKNNKVTIISSEYNNKYIKKFKFIDNVVSLKNENRFFLKIIILIKLIFKLRKIKFNKIIVLDGKKRSFFISLFLTGSKHILLQSDNLKFLSKILKYKFVVNYELQSQLKNISFLANKNNFNIDDKKPNIYIDYIFEKKYDLSNNYINIHLDEKWFSKYYYKDFTDINPNELQLSQFIDKIINNTDQHYDIIITTGLKTIVDEFFKELQKYIRKYFIKKLIIKNNFIANTSFNDIENIIKDSSLLICCEGAVSHVSHFFL